MKLPHPVEPITYGTIFTYHKQILGTGCPIKKIILSKISARKFGYLSKFDFIFGTNIINKVTSNLGKSQKKFFS